jgi:DNA-binding NarL/FixJ family response regulator
MSTIQRDNWLGHSLNVLAVLLIGVVGLALIMARSPAVIVFALLVLAVWGGRVSSRRHRSAQSASQVQNPADEKTRVTSEPLAGGKAASTRDPSTLDRLTPREQEVFRLAAQGLSIREIAAQLFLSPRTVDYHLQKALAKLGIASRVELHQLTLDDDTASAHDPSPLEQLTLEQLTLRERQVVRLVGQGLSIREIAAQLYVSTRTVDQHMRNALAKLGTASRAERHQLKPDDTAR